LGRSPGIGHYHEELLSRKYRFWNFYSYMIAYVWEAKPIQVIAVVHGAPPPHIAKEYSMGNGLYEEMECDR
jgi:plasmid stabilization system protein ParE